MEVDLHSYAHDEIYFCPIICISRRHSMWYNLSKCIFLSQKLYLNFPGEALDGIKLDWQHLLLG